MTILIPSYEPDERLLGLIHSLKTDDNPSILIVDDGSGEDYREIFESAREAGCTVVTHPTNQGKGRALKTGFDYIRQNDCTEGVICADSDGQHLPKDIMRVAHAVRENPKHIVLGSRRFTGKVPARSRFGNTATRMVYSVATGTPIRDTQTGLRGYSSDMLDWLCRIPGERFEYEMNMLLESKSAGYPLLEVPIDTVYLEENKSSHFRPLIDSARIYFPFIKFCFSSGFSAILDFILLFLIQAMGGSLLLSVLGARVGSSLFNFAVNRRFVFAKQGERSAKRAASRYYALVVLLLICNYGLLYAFSESIGIPLFWAKLMTEALLFAISFMAQRKFVY
ncbi:bifunctional glycosyltransferase family 2/GtrA family protein [Cohnella sp. AR92]|uniref:bifunctional glycosyltransferase family 2/GtrA family protein n=1 Tax=Cohnella sp. AR92 TaxID=648716 RepID=UPI000F8F4913|nr:bifunctional glycosyltransferase family 2/GtrA family protein [Cohnella sp. AR92]RUS47928.1 glycosyltransferase [Cohnella sp. AR92]